MPNHVHLLITPQVDVQNLRQKLKGATARQANKRLMRTGHSFWQDESYDRLPRSAEEFQRIERYIVQNPVRAGLASTPQQYSWSSSRLGPE
jgi:REP element-mobilizing transposase RayT